LNSRLTAESVVRKKRAASSDARFLLPARCYPCRAAFLEPLLPAAGLRAAFVLAAFFDDLLAVRFEAGLFFDAVAALRDEAGPRRFAGAALRAALVVAARFVALFAAGVALFFALDVRGALFRLTLFFARLFVEVSFLPSIFATTRFATPVSRAIGERPPPAAAEMPALERSISLLKRFPSSSDSSAARLFRSNHSKNSSHPISSRESSPLNPGKSILRIPGSSSDPVAFTRAG
jgi:hypothetical protein